MPDRADEIGARFAASLERDLRAAGIPCAPGTFDACARNMAHSLRAYAEEAVAQEREACAKRADAAHAEHPTDCVGDCEVLRLAAAIRARGGER